MSALHIQASQRVVEAQQSLCEGSIVQQLQEMMIQKRMKNRVAIKSLVHCTHFLACHHIPHTTNFNKLVNLVVFCGGENVKCFLENAGRNARYTSHIALVEFIEALAVWVEESLLKCLQQASYTVSWRMTV